MEPKCAGFNFQKSRSKCTLHETADNKTKSGSRDFIGTKLRSKKNVSLQMLEMCAEKRRIQRCSAEPKCNNNNCVVGFQKDQYGCNLDPCRCAESNEFIVGDIIMPPEPKKAKSMLSLNKSYLSIPPSKKLKKSQSAPGLWNQNYQNGKYIIPYQFQTMLHNWTKQMVRKASYSTVNI